MAYTLEAAPLRSGLSKAAKSPQVQYTVSKDAFYKYTTEYQRVKNLGLVPERKLVISIWKAAEVMYNSGAKLGYWNTNWATYMVGQAKLKYPLR